MKNIVGSLVLVTSLHDNNIKSINVLDPSCDRLLEEVASEKVEVKHSVGGGNSSVIN